MAVTHKKTQDVSLINFFPSKESNIDLIHSVQSLKDQGLGRRFFDKLTDNKEKILQVDTVSNAIETCGTILQRSIIIATELTARGIEENDIVVLSTRTRSEETIILLATLFVGAILATLDPQAELQDFETVILTLKPALVFCDIRSYKQIELIKLEHSELQHDSIIFGDHNNLLSFDKILAQQTSNLNYVPVSVMDPQRTVAFIVLSQGTSSKSKLICVSHHAMQIQISKFARVLLQNPEQIVSFFPLHWISQLVLVCYCFESPTTRIIPGPFSERLACRLIHDLQIDVAVLGTEYAHRIVEDVSFNDYDLKSLKEVIVGGFLTSAGLMSHLRKQFKNAMVLQCYGLSEMSGFVTGFSTEDYNIAMEKPGSVGKPLPEIKFKILDLDTKKVLGPDWWGELVLTGPTFMLGYYKDDQATADGLHKRFFKTGDVAQFDSDGYLYIQGRVSDFTKVGGKKIFPHEIEEVLVLHKHIVEAAVVGNDKETVACVVKKAEFTLNEDGVMRYLAERLPKDKLPTRIKFLHQLPKTTVGKVKKNLLRQLIFEVTIERTVSFT